MTPVQVCEARALLGWSRGQLAVRCGFGEDIVATYETTGRVRPSRYARTNPVDRVAVIRATLEKAGVTFIEGSSDEPGVKLQKLDP